MAAKHGQPVRQRVGASVRAIREERGLSLSMVARETGLSPSHVSRIERGLTMPSYNVLGHIAHALGTDLAALTSEEQPTRAVDVVLNRLALSADAHADLLRLVPETRAELAALGRPPPPTPFQRQLPHHHR